jgi:hypothetical protein
MRKERLEEHKKPKGQQSGGNNQNGDEMPAEIHQASTVYHGVGGDQSGKGWLEPPGYLR